jgi:hypothetical protein
MPDWRSALGGGLLFAIVGLALAAKVAFEIRKERILSFPPYDRYAEPISFFLTIAVEGIGGGVSLILGIFELLSIASTCL